MCTDHSFLRLNYAQTLINNLRCRPVSYTILNCVGSFCDSRIPSTILLNIKQRTRDTQWQVISKNPVIIEDFEVFLICATKGWSVRVILLVAQEFSADQVNMYTEGQSTMGKGYFQNFQTVNTRELQ